MIEFFYKYSSKAAAPEDEGGWWRFYTNLNYAPTASLTLSENQFNELGRPKKLKMTVEAA